MRTTPQNVKSMVVGALALALLAVALPVKAADDTLRVAKVIKVKHAQFSTDGGHHWTGIMVGQLLSPGAWIRTSDDGEVDVRLGESPVLPPTRMAVANPAAATLYSSQENSDSLVHVYASTVVGIERLSEQSTGVDKVSDTQLNLKQGKILGNVKKLSRASKYEIKLPTGVAGIRGSSYLISSDGTIIMFSGSAVISMVVPVPGGNGAVVTVTFTVNAGESFNPAAVIQAVQNAVPPGTPAAQATTLAQAALDKLATAPPNSPGSPITTTSAALEAAIKDALGDLNTLALSSPSTITITGQDQTILFVSPR